MIPSPSYWRKNRRRSIQCFFKGFGQNYEKDYTLRKFTNLSLKIVLLCLARLKRRQKWFWNALGTTKTDFETNFETWNSFFRSSLFQIFPKLLKTLVPLLTTPKDEKLPAKPFCEESQPLTRNLWGSISERVLSSQESEMRTESLPESDVMGELPATLMQPTFLW